MNNRKNNQNLLEGNIGQQLLKLTLPSIGGMFAMTVFNLTDTFFVAKLGTEALAAMGFTFPIVMIIGAISSGISLGAGSVLARAMGRGDHHLMNRIATDGILLSILSVIFISLIGLMTMNPLFTLLGADEVTLSYVKEYMFIWYSGVAVVVMPPVSDSCMRAMGDMKRPLIVMLICAGMNVILDPIMIYGWFGFPQMGIAGASLATVISRSAGMIVTLSFVHFHYKLIDFKYESLKELIDSWRKILHIGIPGVIVRILPQSLRAILTKLAASVGGTAAVAAVAAGTRVESFATVISMAVGVALVPMIGQNWGAKQFDRVNEIRLWIQKIAISYGLILLLISLPIAAPVARIFTKDSEVLVLTKWYIWILLAASIGLNLYNWTSEALNAAGKPKWVIIVNIVGTGGILIPFVVFGARFYGYIGMLSGLCLGQTLVGIMMIWIGKAQLAGEMQMQNNKSLLEGDEVNEKCL